MSPQSTRRLARQLHDPTITRAWVNNSYNHMIVLFATWDHGHGWYDRRTGETSGAKPDTTAHMPSCYGEDGELLLELDPFVDDGRWPTTGN
jgi:hypothetical protein